MHADMFKSVAAVVVIFVSSAVAARADNFPFETVQLSNTDVRSSPALHFGNPLGTAEPGWQDPLCRAWPGSRDWPTQDEWQQLNASLGGALLRPDPPGIACYQGEQYNATRCRWLLQQASRTNFWIDDPLVVLTQWPQGSTCTAALNARGNCTRGGFPEYVVNATTVRHIQAAVNFARNKNVRLVIKNTGHDFGGRSTGAGSLSVWVHPLKNFDFMANYTGHGYSGMAVRVGAGMESWEMSNHMARHNLTVLSPGGSTVGMVGGWFSAGGHGGLTSKLGLGSDQALSINVVTADGRFVTADPETNTDLWWALRGGGPSTFGIITSVVMRAFPPIRSTSVSVAFSVNPGGASVITPTLPSRRPPAPSGAPFPFPNATVPANFTAPGRGPRGGSNSTLADVETFWTGVKLTYRYCTKVQAVGGYCYSYIYPLGNSSFRFTSSASMPDLSASAAAALMAPLYASLNAAGINISLPRIPDRPAGDGNTTAAPRLRTGGGDSPVNTRYRSRIFPRANWESDELFSRTWEAIRRGIEEGGYTFHGIAYAATTAAAGPLGANSAVNPAWRDGVLHGSFMETQPTGLSAAAARVRDARVQQYVDLWREVTPDSGAYLNEGDPTEPGWQASFFGRENYGRLAAIKRARDPWGVFWARTTVGSEGWEVKTLDGYPASQNGRLCKVEV